MQLLCLIRPFKVPVPNVKSLTSQLNFLESMSRGADQPSRFPPLPCRFSNMQHVADTHHRLMIGFDMFNKLQFNLTENQKTRCLRWFKACRMSFLFQSGIWPRYRKKITGRPKKRTAKIRDAEGGLAMGLEKWSTEKPLKNDRAMKDFKDIWDELNHRGLNQSDSMIILLTLLVGQHIHQISTAMIQSQNLWMVSFQDTGPWTYKVKCNFQMLLSKTNISAHIIGK